MGRQKDRWRDGRNGWMDGWMDGMATKIDDLRICMRLP